MSISSTEKLNRNYTLKRYLLEQKKSIANVTNLGSFEKEVKKTKLLRMKYQVATLNCFHCFILLSFFFFSEMVFPMTQETSQQAMWGCCAQHTTFRTTKFAYPRTIPNGFLPNSDIYLSQSVTVWRLVKPRCHGWQIQVFSVRLYTALPGLISRYENTRWHGK